MPQVSGAPEGLNKILESAYAEALKKYPKNKAKASKIAWGAAKSAGWKKDQSGKWAKGEKKMDDTSGEMADIAVKDMVIFRTGTWNGEHFTEADLDNMAKSFTEPIPIIVGHSSDYKGHTRIPAFGRIMGGLKRVGKELIACGVQFNDKLANWVREGFYNQRSIELTRDNKRVLALGMLGAVPPAVKGLPNNDEALSEISLAFGENVQSKIIEFADAPAIDFEVIEDLATEDTLKNIDEEFATCLADIENHLASDDESDEVKQHCMDALVECYSNIAEEINEHFSFTEKLEELEPEETESMMAKLKDWLGIKTITKRKEQIDMDAMKEKEYQEKISALDIQLKEFAAKEQAAIEAKTKAEAEAKEAEAKAKVEATRNEIKLFCDTAIKENRMTPAMREKDETIMFELSQANIGALKSFQQKYSKPVVPLGVVKEVDVNQSHDAGSQVMKQAEEYAVAHAKDKEFAGLDKDKATKRAFFLFRNGQIKFESNKQTKGA